MSPAASDLAMVLTRGLSLEHQKSSRDSLQYSSGYSTQTTTPSCSEDTIPSQGTGTREHLRVGKYTAEVLVVLGHIFVLWVS